MREIKSFPYLNYVSKESNKVNDLILDRHNDEKTMSGITEGMHKIAIHSEKKYKLFLPRYKKFVNLHLNFTTQSRKIYINLK